MEILAVVIGYLLGIAPFVVPKIVELIQQCKTNKMELKEAEEQKEIFDEYLNGVKTYDTPQEGKFSFNQEDMYNEYITGQETMKGD